MWMFLLGLAIGIVAGAVVMACCAINNQWGDDDDRF